MTNTTTTAAIEALPIETAPKNGTMLRLLVDYTDEGENPLEDEHHAWTIGFNQLSDTEEDVWEFAGWSWEQDCFSAGVGKVIGWLPFHAARDLVPALAAERDAALNEGAKLAAWQCAFTDGQTGLVCDEYGNQFCAMQRRAEKAETEAAALRGEVARLKGMADRKKFPILGERGVYVDFQLVADHGQQANSNHGQTVSGLAARGGLSWCELFAVLHNRRWEKMDANDAMIACRALETRYLAALTSKGGEG